MSNGQLSNVEDGAWGKIRHNFARIKVDLGPSAIPVFSSVIITGLTASRLVWTDASKALVSKDLIDLVAGTANRVIVTDDGSGGVALSGPQDYHTEASPTFAGITLKDSNDDVYLFASEEVFYIVEAGEPAEIVAGNPMGLLLLFTYPATP